MRWRSHTMIEDSRRSDPLCPAKDCAGCELNYRPEDRGCDAAIDLDEPLERTVRQFGRPTQRQGVQKASDQAMEVCIVPPRREAVRLEAAVEMGIASDRISRLVRAETNQGNAQFVAEEAQQIEHSSLFPVRAGDQILHLVDDQHAGRGFSKQPQRLSFKLPEGGAARRRRCCW